ncbi:MAG: chromate transporter [Bacteroidaceae bacterium]|nr:chromate transporter [Bacteroidaceae bacterium]MBR1467827.1 chromate transporter [Bacteroidaceae bacterium]
MIFLQLFITFFQIGLFGFGGGYAMLSMIQSDVVYNHHWLTAGQFTDIVAVSQMTPGPIGINSATYVGYTAVVNAGYPTWAGILGSCMATMSVILPSLILMIIISRFLMRYHSHPVVRDVFQGLRPAVVGLLAAAALLLCTADNFGSPSEDSWQFGISIGLFAFTFIGQQTYHINPIRLILMCGAAGLLLL